MTKTGSIRAGIAGAAGYTGGEALRILLRHPKIDIVFAQSTSQQAKPLSSVHGDLAGETDLKFAEAPDYSSVDVLFLCMGHGESARFISGNDIPPAVRIIDLSQDFRLKERAHYANRDFVYGLPELNREAIRKAQNIANPGCFATAIQLGLLPLVKAGFTSEVFTTGITGSTGAGQGLSPTSHFSWRSNNIQAYKTLTHQHMGEINQSLAEAGAEPRISFVPWRGDFARGIFISSQFRSQQSVSEIAQLLRDYYAGHPFTSICDEPIHLKQVVNTNKCLLHVEGSEGTIVVHSAIDNLVKGASGQAVQNMNLMFGLDERAGLDLKASYF